MRCAPFSWTVSGVRSAWAAPRWFASPAGEAIQVPICRSRFRISQPIPARFDVSPSYRRTRLPPIAKSFAGPWMLKSASSIRMSCTAIMSGYWRTWHSNPACRMSFRHTQTSWPNAIWMLVFGRRSRRRLKTPGASSCPTMRCGDAFGLVGEATSGEIDGRIALAPWNASGRLSDDTQKRVAWFAVLYAQVLAERIDRS